ncbi:MAG TPA: hypothetical protein ENI51_07970 [Candidatus Atribacteria bacterium]|nr:hypothetical protein [Candidatus Atribacteria bacterium]
MKIQISPNIFSISIFFIICFILIIFYYYFRKETSFTDVWLYLKLIFYSLVIIAFLFVFALEIIQIFITQGVEEGSESWLFLLLNALLMGMYLNILGVQANTKSSVRFLLLFILIYLSVSGFGYLGILIIINEPISNYLLYNIYQSNSAHGIYFVWCNLAFFIVILFLSFTTESDN